MTFRRLRRSAPAPETPYRTPPPQRQYAPPPGPPSNWEVAFGFDPEALARQQRPPAQARPAAEEQVRILSHDEELQRLSKACNTAKGNAQLLRETVAYTKPEELVGNDLLAEFRKKCHQSHKFITTTIPWATVEAEQSHSRASSQEETKEESLLAQLLAANEEVMEALKMYDQAAKGAIEQEERGKKRAESKLRALDAVILFEPTSAETSLVDRVLEIGDLHGRGSISVHAAHKILGGSRLPPETLSAICDIANVEENEMFSRHCIGVAIRLIGHAQKGTPITEALVTKAGPLATIDGLEASRPEDSYLYAGPSTSASSSSTSRLPSPGLLSTALPHLTSEDRQKFLKIFNNNQPVNGFINGPRARELFMKSRLPNETLARIWELADTHKQGALDLPSFTIAMYLIQALMSGTLSSVPPYLPPQLYAEAALSTSTAAFDMQFVPEHGPSSSSEPHSPAWDVPADVRSNAETFFEVFDEQRQGYLSRNVIEAHLKQTGLPENILQHIWHLSDLDGNGRLSRDEFAVALYLVQMAERREALPSSLPNMLVPPARRSPPPGVSIQTVTADLIGLNFSDDAAESSVLGRSITPASSPPPLPSRSPMSPTSASIFQSPLPSTPSTSSNAFDTRLGSSTHTAGWTWDVTPADKANSDRFFETLDPWKHGYIEGDVAVTFLSKSKLPHEDLGQIWDLADINRDGRLTKEEFAVAMYLIRAKLAGRAIPETLPTSLVPPANLPTLPDNGTSPAAAPTPGPPLPPRPAATQAATVTPQPSTLESQAVRDETVSPQRTATPPPPYEEPDVANTADS